jgi:hypothetical protein
MESNNKKRLRLDELTVESFITNLDKIGSGVGVETSPDLCARVTVQTHCGVLCIPSINILKCSNTPCTHPEGGCGLTQEGCLTHEAKLGQCA